MAVSELPSLVPHRLPSDSSTASPASSSTGTPRDSALSSFDPAFCPATTKLVFFETEPDTLPPCSAMASAASSLCQALQRARQHDGDPGERSAPERQCPRRRPYP